MAEEKRAELLNEIVADRELVFRFFGGGELVGRLIDAAGYVTFVLFARVDTGMQGVRLLIERRLTIEAAVLALSMFEAKLDMLYIGADASQGDTWLAHTDPLNQPWKFQPKIRALYKGDDQHRELTIFRLLSAIKHGNPVAGEAGFHERRTPGEWHVQTGGFGDRTGLALSLIIGQIARAQYSMRSSPRSAHGRGWASSTLTSNQRSGGGSPTRWRALRTPRRIAAEQ
jgi:hypothetical protein